jgi:hypothetical protein
MMMGRLWAQARVGPAQMDDARIIVSEQSVKYIELSRGK